MRPVLLFALLLVTAGVRAETTPEDGLVRAIEAVLAGDLQAAERELAPLLSMRPRFHLAHLIQADLLAARAGRAPALADTADGAVRALAREARRRLAGRERALALAGLPSNFLRVPDSVDALLVADVGNSRLLRLGRRDGRLEPVADYYMSIGRLGAGKQRAWDRRTPLGVYFFVARLEDDELAERYGALAFPVDYPNAWDLNRGRSGDGIWLHGIDRAGYSRPPRDSDGCVVVANDDLLALAPYIAQQSTPLIVAREFDWQQPAGTDDRAVLAAELETTLENWRSAWEAGDAERWLAHYADEFAPPGHADGGAWRAARGRALAQRAVQAVVLRELMLVRYPEEEGLFMARFRLDLSTANGSRASLKRLYLRRDERGGFRIVAAGNG
ncbi:MAG: L,D-transpeptidase family protein [Pseudomonadota bacterium]